MNDTIACINFDIMNIFGRTHDVTFYGRGGNELDDLADEAAAIQKRRVDGDPTPENGMFYRSDHFNFAKMGVPALFINMGFDHVERGKEYLLKKQIEWTAKCYHKELDQVYTDPEHPWCWDLSGATEDVQLVFMVAAKLVTNQTLRPKWRPTNEFAKVRGN
jgi:Zn-dependent M28 family amino/carboxypeptidase